MTVDPVSYSYHLLENALWPQRWKGSWKQRHLVFLHLAGQQKTITLCFAVLALSYQCVLSFFSVPWLSGIYILNLYGESKASNKIPNNVCWREAVSHLVHLTNNIPDDVPNFVLLSTIVAIYKICSKTQAYFCHHSRYFALN